ncbi:hypothetical protein SAMN04489764_0530 [Thermostaphylospora chromogena]|uniref:Uncharacterized protein n=1 Tax=Thermostaphylospora chromogena TaxID=35622 RepID=A0A1H1AK20_9ACTN|nr:hypothetical protein SAMN04489764_0530 [Thermostaphylospora chromogena]
MMRSAGPDAHRPRFPLFPEDRHAGITKAVMKPAAAVTAPLP